MVQRDVARAVRPGSSDTAHHHAQAPPVLLPGFGVRRHGDTGHDAHAVDAGGKNEHVAVAIGDGRTQDAAAG